MCCVSHIDCIIVHQAGCASGAGVGGVSGMGGADGGCKFTFKLDAVYKLADTLFCRRVHDKWIPSWASDTIIDYLYALDGWTMYQMFTGDVERRLTASQQPYQSTKTKHQNTKTDIKNTSTCRPFSSCACGSFVRESCLC